VRVAAPDAACVEVDGLRGRRYRARGGMYEMPARDGQALVAAGGFVPSMAGTSSTGLGFRCGGCGFGSYLRRCGRCGAECEREADAGM
jgi:hypothetical protein